MQKILENLKNKKTTELTYEDFKILKKYWIINGCGGKNCGILQKIILKILTPVFFEASCDLHDFGYWKGWNEARRLECDQKFYEKILEDLDFYFWEYSTLSWYKVEQKSRLRHFARFWNSLRSNSQNHFVARRFLKMYYKILAKIFYIAVRIGGKKYFNYN